MRTARLTLTADQTILQQVLRAELHHMHQPFAADWLADCHLFLEEHRLTVNASTCSAMLLRQETTQFWLEQLVMVAACRAGLAVHTTLVTGFPVRLG